MQKTVLITGSSSGIGKATVKYFQEKGWNVAATMRQPNKEQELGTLSNVKLYALDVTNNESIAKALHEVTADFGRIDVLVNNAGYAAIGIFEAADRDIIQRQFDTNVFGLMAMSKAILPFFRKNNGGTIVNVASVGGRLCFPLYSLYHATKWAVDGFSESLQYELKPFNIKVRIIEPGLIKTDFYSRSQQVLAMNEEPEYERILSKGEKTIANFTKMGSSPETVAKCVYKAAISSSGKLRYPIAGGARLFLLMRKITPDRLFRAFVQRVYFGGKI